MKRIDWILIILIFCTASAWAATEMTWSDKLATHTATDMDADDMFLGLFDPNGTPVSRMIGRDEAIRAWLTDTANAGTDITADLEEEAHASEHAVSAADTIFPADPDADRVLMWDDDPGALIWYDISGAGFGDMLKATYDVSADGFVDGNDVAYAAAWNGDVNAPSMNAVYDEMETKGDIAGQVWTGAHDFGGADLELPQSSPASVDTDGKVAFDFTDGSLVVQHGSAHAELSSATDVVMGKLIHSFSATLAMPDLLQAETDAWPLKAIESTEFPHGIVVTDIYLKVSDMSGYDLNVENWDDPNTINGANPTIDNIVCTAHSQDENFEDTITYSTIAAGQIIMLDLPPTDVSFIYVQVEYYEPIA